MSVYRNCPQLLPNRCITILRHDIATYNIWTLCVKFKTKYSKTMECDGNQIKNARSY